MFNYWNLNLLQQHQQLRQENVIQPTQNHRQKKRKCGYCGILKSVELNWTKCKHSRCNINYCPICQENIARHENVCGTKKVILSENTPVKYLIQSYSGN